MYIGIRFPRRALGLLAAATMLFAGVPALAAEVSGVKLDATALVSNQTLKLNGAGIRYRAVFKVYVAALYLPEKKTTVSEVLAAPGAKRVTLVMLREVGSEELGRAFLAGIRKNTDRAETAKIVPQLQTFGEIFASVAEMKKGDVLTTDWIPGVGMHIQLNGKKISDIIPGEDFYNALLRIWLGEQPADASLKVALLGAQ
jgi:hypothetical protein